jgi:hypothetical protein
LGIIAILLAAATAGIFQPQPLVAVNTGKTLDKFGACFTQAQETAGRAWAVAATDEGGSFTDEGASGVTAPYRLQVSKQAAGNSLRLYAVSLSAAAPVAKAVEQCR